jgi:NADH:ubiquinone oxidoreductase subunit 4 (subunit M)
LRLLTCRDLGRAAGYLATSATALTWGLAGSGEQLALFAFWMSLPAALTTLLDGMLVRRFGAAYAGLCPGLGGALPRYAALLVVTLLAAVATPPFPGFFALLGLLHGLNGLSAIVVLVIWLVWAWAAVRLLQGFVAGTCREGGIDDLRPGSVMAWIGVLVVFAGAGFYFTGGGL